MTYLTLGSCLKNEEPYMKDFVKYHRHVGVERFVFFDREYHKLKDMFKNDPDVEIHHFPDVPENVHAIAWANLIGINKGKTKWLALIDADQVLVPALTTDVKDILRNYEQFASVQCNWHTFGSSGHLTNTGEPLYERFLMRAESNAGINNHTQFICQPDRTLAERTHDPHHPRLPSGEQSVNTNQHPVVGPFNAPPLHNMLWIAHYISKSKEEWDIKNAKGRADIFGQKMPYDLFVEHDKFCNAVKETRVLELWKEANK